ncbi:MAG: hypothetical protein Q4E36_02580 [Bacillota bacterium]|nr:hypothetical protein [Bacillota bacterium]
MKNSLLVFKDLSKKNQKEKLVFSKDQREKLLQNLCPEKILYHQKFGKGQMTKVQDGIIYVDFNGQEKMFSYPQVFFEGFLKILD